MTVSIEKPGYITAWKELNDLLDVDERFECIQGEQPKILLAPKQIAKISSLIHYLQSQQITYQIRGRGTNSMPSSAQVILSTQALNRIQRLDQGVIAVEVGCDLRTLQRTLCVEGIELGLENGLGESDKRSVGGILLEDGQFGLVLGGVTRIQERLLGIEWVEAEGSLSTWGHKLEAAALGSALHRMLRDRPNTQRVMVQVYFKVTPIPTKRLELCWSLEDRAELWAYIKELQKFCSSWERLDVVIPYNLKEKGLILAQIAGLETEIQAFKRECPSIEKAEIRDGKFEKVKKFLLQNSRSYQQMSLENCLASNSEGDYVWHHTLTKQTWLITSRDIALQEYIKG